MQLLQDTDDESAEFILCMTQAIAEAPVIEHLSTLDCVTTMSSSKKDYKMLLADEGDSRQLTWVSQLRMLPSVSTSKAVAIAGRYPSFSLLMRAYMDERASQAEKEKMIAKIPKCNAATSKNIYAFFTAEDGSTLIGSHGH